MSPLWAHHRQVLFSAERLPGGPSEPRPSTAFARSVSTPDGRLPRLNASHPHARPPAARDLPAGSLTFLATGPEHERSTVPGAPDKKHAGSPLGEPKRRGAKQQQKCGPERQTSGTDHRDHRDAKPGADHRPRDDVDPRPHGLPTERSPRPRAPGFAGSAEEPDPGSGLAVVRAVFDGRPVEWRVRFDVRALMEEGSPAGAVDADAESGGQIHLVAARALARELERKAEREACDSGGSRSRVPPPPLPPAPLSRATTIPTLNACCCIFGSFASLSFIIITVARRC
ncbi:uncharacterized protein LOC142905604 [Petromyzon marinus]|uniref:uncharacterized protein LOC142905604 n=1 Tax=Petromyzon marinus TaxID=7757 RepID=UPI003F72704E